MHIDCYLFTNIEHPYKAMLCRALQTQHPVGQTPTIVTNTGSLVIGHSGHLTRHVTAGHWLPGAEYTLK